MNRRFDSVDYLEAFRDRGAYPAIHDDMFTLVLECSRQSRFLDLCCCTGLLGERVKRIAGADLVIGVDVNDRAMDLGRSHGVEIPMRRMDVRKDTLPDLASLIAENGITAVVGRRCLPEILGFHPEMDAAFAATLADSGVVELFLEGRVVTPRSVNRLGGIAREIAAVSSRFRPVVRRGMCCLLRSAEQNPLDVGIGV